jgi:hypothetical protein
VRGHAARVALEQLETEFLFQVGHPSGQRRLGHPQALRGAPEMKFLGDGEEVPQVADLHSPDHTKAASN